MPKLDNQVAVVTGAGSGIGRATAVALAREGARVIVADSNLHAARQTVALIHSLDPPGSARSVSPKGPGETVSEERTSSVPSRAPGAKAGGSGQTKSGHSVTHPSGVRAVAFQANVAAAADAAALVELTVHTFGKLNILVNNAGIGVVGTILTTSEEDWDRLFAVNVKGVFLCSRAAIPKMIEQGGGAIVNVASAVAMVAVADRAAYGASKGAVLALTRAMAADHVRDHIRVNCVCPGTVDTPWVERMVQSYTDPEQARRSMVARQPVGRLGTPEEIAEAILYLVLPEAGFVTGSALVIDGGFTAFTLPA